MHRLFVPICVIASVTNSLMAETHGLKPLLTVPDKVVLNDDFSKPRPLQKSKWQPRQGTRWAIEDGVLRGKQSSPEYQAKREHHYGYEARLSIPVTPQDFAAKFSVRFIGGTETGIAPFIEFGHHVCRVRFSKHGAWLLSDGETMRLAEAKKFKWQPGKWYHVLAERKGSEFVMQIANGPTLYGQRDSFAKKVSSGGAGFGVAGPKKGMVEIDNMTIWSIKPKRLDFDQSKIPKYTPVQIKKPKKKAK